MKRKLFVSIVAVILMLSLTLVGCTSEAGEETIDISYVNWTCATASTYLVKNILEEQGYQVNLHDLQAGMMWQSLTSDDADLIICAWLPGTHANYYSEVEDEVVNVGANFDGAMIGLVVPSYVEIDSIEELNDHLDEFGGQIVGIDAGAGIMGATADAIEEYDLELVLLESSDAAMTAELSRAITNEEWVVVTGWAPHWKFADYDLKFLEDPKGVFGGEESINTITRKDFASDQPEVQKILDNYYLTPEELGGLIAMMEEYDDRDEAAQKWMEENRTLVDSWIE